MQVRTASPMMILLTETSEKYKIVPGFKSGGTKFLVPIRACGDKLLKEFFSYGGTEKRLL